MTDDDNDFNPSEARAKEARLAAVVAEHLPPPAPGERFDNNIAVIVITGHADRETSFYASGRGDVEQRKLDDFVRCAVELARLYDALDPRIRANLICDGTRPEAMKVVLPSGRNIDLTDIPLLPLALSIVLPRVEDYLAGLQPVGRANLQAVGTVRGCRFVWRQRVGDAPARGLNPASPFGRFLADVLEALGIEANPVAAFDAWRRVETYPEDRA
ncbi:hypothetical protein [Falsiroseomonas sp.]|uniref:hypothetical protein n=1 Tax=Falsiroseomonas sp. TaxID=2870721 RepID=UPI0034A1D67B